MKQFYHKKNMNRNKKKQARIALLLMIAVPVFTLSSCTMKAIEVDPTTTIEVPETMPTVTLASDDGSIPDLESLEAKGSSDPNGSSAIGNEAEGNTESKEQDSSAEGSREGIVDVLPTATPRPSNIDESQEGDGPDPTAEPSEEGGLPTAQPTSTPSATASATPTSTPSATQTPSSTPTAQATATPQATSTPASTAQPSSGGGLPTASATPSQTPASTQTPAATQQPQATQTPSSGGDQGSQQASTHKHEWVPLYALDSTYLGNCQWQDDVMYKCYGCGETKQDKSSVYTGHHAHYDQGLNMVEVKPTCTTGGYSDCDNHHYCDCGYIDEWEHIHWDLDPIGHHYNHVVNSSDCYIDENGDYWVHYEDVCTCGDVASSGYEKE